MSWILDALPLVAHGAAIVFGGLLIALLLGLYVARFIRFGSGEE